MSKVVAVEHVESIPTRLGQRGILHNHCCMYLRAIVCLNVYGLTRLEKNDIFQTR